MNFVLANILFSLILTLLPTMAAAADYRVCSSCPHKSLNAAIASASNGDTISIEKGHYNEGTVEVFKSLKIIGIGNPIIDGNHKGHVFYVRANDVHIEGLTIQNSGQSYISDFAGIRVEHVSGLIIRKNIFVNNTYSIYFEKVTDSLIEANRISSNAKNEVSAGNGVHLFYSYRIKVINNEISGQRDGLYFEFTEDSLVNENHCHDNLRFGMHFMFSHRNKFAKNRFSDNPTGVAIMYSRTLEVFDNVFEYSKGNASYGFLIKEIVDSKFENNRFSENTLGIFLNGSNRNLFKNNDFELNGWAVNIYSNSYDNIFTQNNFKSNNFDVTTNSRRSSSSFDSNYWSSYRGYDLNRDGVGDIEYRPVSLYSFWVANFPELAVLLNSPVVLFLEVAERFFPLLTPKSLVDKNPSMQPIVASGNTTRGR